MAILDPRKLRLRAIWANIYARGLAGKVAARRAYHGTKALASGFEEMRKSTFKGQVFNDILEQIRKNPKLQAAQATIAQSQGKAKAAIENTIDAVTDAATAGVKRASERVIQSASRNPVVALGTMVGATIAEGSMRAGRDIGKRFVHETIDAPPVQHATEAYGAYRAVAGDKARRAARVLGRYLRGEQWEGGEALRAAAKKANVTTPEAMTMPGMPKPRLRKKLTLARLFGIKPRALPATGGTLSPKAVTEGVAGEPGRARKFLVDMGLGSETSLAKLDAEIKDLHRKLRQSSRAIGEARKQLKLGVITQEQFTAVVKKNTRPKAEVDALKARLQERLSLRRTGGYDVDRGHYLAVAGGLGYVAQKKARERYATWQGGTEERAAKRMQEQLFNTYKNKYRRANPKASEWEIENSARAEVANTVRRLELATAMREAAQVREMMQGYPDPRAALVGYVPPGPRRAPRSRVNVRSRLRRRQR